MTRAQRRPRTPSPKAPRGRAEVRAAVVAAAAELFATRGPSAVSIRDIAERALVNHGLVHRHFGAKDKLVRAVMDGLAQDLDAGAAAHPAENLPADLFALAERSRYWRILARALLDGADPRDLQGGFPVVRRFLARARAAKQEGLLKEDIDPRLIVAMSLALSLGWLVFAPFIVAATGLGESAEKPQKLLATWFGLLARERPSPSAR
jgi:AcrR family transcriptional regulator